jgi:hypothetical protein
MNAFNIPHLRLKNTGLSGAPFESPEDVVAHLGAVQSQDFAAAKWALGMRMRHGTDKSVEKAFDDGRILRTHVLRPTWHFVMPEDIQWMLELTALHVKKKLATNDRKLNITGEVLAESQALFEKALEGNNHLTRAELADHLERNGIVARGQRLGHIVAHAELDAIICSGPKRGKQFTYALLEERAPMVKKMDRGESLAKLALTYFTGHGPAQIQDFAWWSGLSTKVASEGLNLVRSKLISIDLSGKTYWFSSEDKGMGTDPPTEHQHPVIRAFLLSIYDEYSIAYKDRGDISDERDIERMISLGNALTAIIILDGKVAGTWKRVLKKNTVEIGSHPFKKLNNSEQEAVVEAARQYGKFLNKEIVIGTNAGRSSAV